MWKSLIPSRASAAIGAAGAAVGIPYYSTTRTLSAESPSPPNTFTRGPNLVTLKLHSTELVNHDTRRLRFELPDPSARSGLSLTSAVLTISRPNGRWLPVVRPYTPVNDLHEPGFLEFLVKHYPSGAASTHLHALTPGQTLTFAGPIPGGMAWEPNKHPHVALLAGGAGITPMYQLARGILANPADRTRITLVWGVNTPQDLFLKDEFEALRKEYPERLKLVYTVSKPEAESSSSFGNPSSFHQVSYHEGRITKEVLEQAGLLSNQKDTKVLICGPPAMEAALTGGKQSSILSQLGYTSSQIHRF